jgi:hypothetical protein
MVKWRCSWLEWSANIICSSNGTRSLNLQFQDSWIGIDAPMSGLSRSSDRTILAFSSGARRQKCPSLHQLKCRMSGAAATSDCISHSSAQCVVPAYKRSSTDMIQSKQNKHTVICESQSLLYPIAFKVYWNCKCQSSFLGKLMYGVLSLYLLIL